MAQPKTLTKTELKRVLDVTKACSRYQDTPRQCLGVKARSSDWDLERGLHQG